MNNGNQKEYYEWERKHARNLKRKGFSDEEIQARLAIDINLARKLTKGVVPKEPL